MSKKPSMIKLGKRVEAESEKRQKEEATTERWKEKYYALLDDIAYGYVENDLAGNITFCNKTAFELAGYTQEEYIGSNYKILMDEETAKRVYIAYNKIYKTGKPNKSIVFEIIRKDGKRRVVENSVSLMKNAKGEAIGFRVIIRDITKHKEAEEALRNSEEKYRTLLDDIAEGYYEVDLKGNYIRFNNSWLNMIGYTRDELIGQSYKKIMDKETAKYVYRAFNRIFRSGGHDNTLEFDVIRKDGTKRTWENSVVLIRDKEGNRIGFRGVNRDITDRKIAQLEKERYRQNLEAIFRSVKDAIITVDNDMKVIEANKATKTVCGLTPEEIMGRTITDCPNKCVKSCYSVLKETLREKKTVRDYRIECQHNNNPRHIVVVTASPLLDQDETFNGAVLVMRDETKFLNLERQLRERHHFANIIGKSRSMWSW